MAGNCNIYFEWILEKAIYCFAHLFIVGSFSMYTITTYTKNGKPAALESRTVFRREKMLNGLYKTVHFQKKKTNIDMLTIVNRGLEDKHNKYISIHDDTPSAGIHP